jgi:hypothetical protein
MITITPARDGLVLRDPTTRQILPMEGIVVRIDHPDLTYWLRRQAEGDAVVTDDVVVQE